MYIYVDVSMHTHICRCVYVGVYWRAHIYGTHHVVCRADVLAATQVLSKLRDP